MKYRRFGKLNWNVSILGFGAMRLPVFNQDPAQIDEPNAIKMLRYAIDQGVNYIDTAYPYHRGQSEIVVGKSLKDGYRERVRVATKMPTWQVNSHEEMDTILQEQLDRLQIDHIDFYLLHGLNKERWNKMQKLHVFQWGEKNIREGKIRYLGFSFHDEFDVFKDIVDRYNGWSFCQIQYNYLDAEYQAGMRGLKYAVSKGLAVVVMEPIAGGLLAFPPFKEIHQIWDEATIVKTPAEWALQWVWNQSEVSVVLSGMSTMEQVVENITSANRAGPGILNQEALTLIARVKEKYREYGIIGCSDCHYCQPCPQGVDIPKIFNLYNEYFMKGRDREVIKKYFKVIPSDNGVKNCIKCGDCEEKCPQQLPIRTLLAKAAFLFQSGT
jgi:predicted aldo/keto reductase-like oxidoreductase